MNVNQNFQSGTIQHIKIMKELDIKHKAKIAADESQLKSNHKYDHKSYEDGFIEGMNSAIGLETVDESKTDYQLRVKAFRKDLVEYFSNNLIDGWYRIEKFRLTGTDIIPLKPDLEESYDGGNNKDIEELCKKHNVNFSIIYWCYPK